MIAFWPKGISVKKGSISGRTGHVMDFMATFIELANATYPSTYNGHAIKPMQGLSLTSAFKNKNATGHNVLFNEHYGARYVRSGEWKLVSHKNEKWHLYNIDADETELNDLASQHPDIVEKLDKLWQDWAKENQVFPKAKQTKQ